MQKIAIGILSLMILTLAALNARHQARERILEERIAAVEKKAKRKPTPVVPVERGPVPAAEIAAPAPLPAPAATAAPVPASVSLLEKISPLDLHNPSRTEAVYSHRVTFGNAGNFTFPVTNPEAELNLTDAQRSAIDRLRELQAAQSQQIEQAIRELMTPEQQAQYDARGSVQTYWSTKTDLVTLPVADLKWGYLGVSGGDASGGGAEVTRVLPNTAASASGLQPGDVILEVNGEPIAGLSALSETIRRTGEGFAANLRIRRGSVEFIQGLQLGSSGK